MSLAIKFGDSTNQNSLSGSVYFSAVTSYTKDHSGRVTEHPIEAGASISDHFISNNPKFSIEGVISSVDFSNIPSMVFLGDTLDPVENNRPEPIPVSILDTSGLRRLIPGVVDQFIPVSVPTVTMEQPFPGSYKMSMENLFESIINGLFYNPTRKRWENRMTTAILYELEGSQVTKPIPNLVMTSCRVSEDEESGDSLFVSMSFEQVRFVTLEKAEAPKPTETKTQRGASEKKDMGNKPGTIDNPKNPPNDRVTVQGEMNKAVGGI